MKKVIYLLLASALVVGLGQCKKKVETISSVPASVYITLDVEGGDKVIVDPYHSPTYASVTFEAGDVIYVGNNKAYCGYLTHDGTKFGGNITPTSGDDADFLHFYFMGNKGPVGSAPTEVYIADQTRKYPVISYGRSIQLYNSGTSNYSATLQNYCSIMKFPIAGAGTESIVAITGMNNLVSVDFSKNTIGSAVNPYSYSKRISKGPYEGYKGSGEIFLHSENINEKWAIVLPQGSVDAELYTHDYVYTAAVHVPAINTNEYHNNDINEINLAETKSSFTPALFSVAAGRQVRFSPGNLQATYDGTSWSWGFAPRQWGSINILDGNPLVTDQEPWISAPGTVDLFGWSSISPTNYYGINSYYEGRPGQQTPYDGDFKDWGTNAIGSYAANTWRTLTIEEWRYLFSYKDSSMNYENPARAGKYGAATVNGVYGWVLLPDNWTLPAGCTFNAGYAAKPTYNHNVYDADAWDLMEQNGAVFLPAAGNRNGTEVMTPLYYDPSSTFMNNLNANGTYWSSSIAPPSSHYSGYPPYAAYMVMINQHPYPPRSTASGYTYFSNGFSVRLVR